MSIKRLEFVIKVTNHGMAQNYKGLNSGEDKERQLKLRKLYHYDSEDTCATDGLCKMNCLVNFDTGKLTKQLRFDQHSSLENGIINWCKNNFALASKLARLGWGAANLSHKLLGKKVLIGLSGISRKVSGYQILP